MVTNADIEEKRNILLSMAPFSEGLKELKRKLDLLDFAFSDLKLAGSILTRDGVTRILDGIMIPDVPVDAHRLVEAHRKLKSRFDDKAEMQLDADGILLNEFCMILAGTELLPYRNDAPLLYHLDFVPGDPDSISKDLAEVFRGIRRTDFGGDGCLRAAALHLGIVRVYPFEGGYSEMAARVSLQYELLRSGYFPVDLGVGEQEYNRVTAEGVKTGDPSEFAEIIRVAVLKKIHHLIDAANRGV
ncbi:MAG: hypothetical protein LBS85_01610 [Clostridiales Family XIII bacterium]|jgi:hypothetical protein|nr:hypothetical protein [Clostridiales Family XIII bacterium]